MQAFHDFDAESVALATELAAEDAAVAALPSVWKPGQSGNPAGRPKGSKNYVTEQRLAMESALRDYMAKPERKAKVMKLIDRVLNVGLTGDDKNAVNAAKLIFDKVLSGAKQDEAADGASAPRVHIIIENSTGATARQAAPSIEAEFTEVPQPKDNQNV